MGSGQVPAVQPVPSGSRTLLESLCQHGVHSNVTLLVTLSVWGAGQLAGDAARVLWVCMEPPLLSYFFEVVMIHSWRAVTEL